MGQPGYSIRYDFVVDGQTIIVRRNGEELPTQFSTTEKDSKDSVSPLSTFLQSIGRSQVDAHAVCVALESGQTVSAVFGNK